MKKWLAVGLVLVLAAAGGGIWWWHAHNVRVPLLSSSVGILGDGARVSVEPGDGRTFYPGTRVLEGSEVGGAALASGQRRWLAEARAALPSSAYSQLVDSTLLDLDTLLLDNGAAVTSWPRSWRYVWPRDASFAAVALARSGQRDDALAVLAYLQRMQPTDGAFDARYLPDGSGKVPDARGEQSDGAAWALWATDQVRRSAPTGVERVAVTTHLEQLIRRSTAALMTATGTADHLPPPSPDYWEVPSDKLSLGTAAPMALGLAGAADLLQTTGDPQAMVVRERAQAVAAAIRTHFGPNYPQYLGGTGGDAALAFMLPPFTSCTDPVVLTAWRTAYRAMRRPAGGVAPGANWKEDGITWTPETALFALNAVSVGDTAQAKRWLDWLNAHRTLSGSIPEKVLSNGDPAGPAPLSWSGAMVIMTVAALAQPPAPACPV